MERLRIAASILDFEARRDKQGRLTIYRLPLDDGGGQRRGIARCNASLNLVFHAEEASLDKYSAFHRAIEPLGVIFAEPRMESAAFSPIM
jgi:hypothetical protein